MGPKWLTISQQAGDDYCKKQQDMITRSSPDILLVTMGKTLENAPVG
jgi:hypothetical protein